MTNAVHLLSTFTYVVLFRFTDNSPVSIALNFINEALFPRLVNDR